MKKFRSLVILNCIKCNSHHTDDRLDKQPVSFRLVIWYDTWYHFIRLHWRWCTNLFERQIERQTKKGSLNACFDKSIFCSLNNLFLTFLPSFPPLFLWLKPVIKAASDLHSSNLIRRCLCHLFILAFKRTNLSSNLPPFDMSCCCLYCSATNYHQNHHHHHHQRQQHVCMYVFIHISTQRWHHLVCFTCNFTWNHIAATL